MDVLCPASIDPAQPSRQDLNDFGKCITDFGWSFHASLELTKNVPDER